MKNKIILLVLGFFLVFNVKALSLNDELNNWISENKDIASKIVMDSVNACVDNYNQTCVLDKIVAELNRQGYTEEAEALNQNRDEILNITVADKEEIKESVTDSINTLTNNAITFIDSFKVFSVTYSNALIDSIDEQLVTSIKSCNDDFVCAFDKVVAKLNSKGFLSASINLNSLRGKVVTLNNDYEKVMNSLSAYLLINEANDFDSITDLFIDLKQNIQKLKTPMNNLLKIYYDDIYERIEDRIDNIGTNNIIDIYNDIINKLDSYTDLEMALLNKINKFESFYNSYNLTDYENIIKRELNSYRDYYRTNLIDRLDVKLNSYLDNKINDIVDNTDITNNDSVIDRNTKLYDIMSKINELKQSIIDFINERNNKISFPLINEYIVAEKEYIGLKFDEAYTKTESYIIDILLIENKNAIDASKLIIDNSSDIILTKFNHMIGTDFLNKLKPTYGTLNAKNLYNDKIGTLSKVEVNVFDVVAKSVTIVVVGDVSPTGEVDITDIVRTCNHMFGKITLEGYEYMAADTDMNNTIDITDIVNIANIMFGKEI